MSGTMLQLTCNKRRFNILYLYQFYTHWQWGKVLQHNYSHHRIRCKHDLSSTCVYLANERLVSYVYNLHYSNCTLQVMPNGITWFWSRMIHWYFLSVAQLPQAVSMKTFNFSPRKILYMSHVLWAPSLTSWISLKQNQSKDLACWQFGEKLLSFFSVQSIWVRHLIHWPLE